jgi:hypothetical protein
MIANNSVQLFIYLRAELNSQWPSTESARIQQDNKDKTHKKQQNKEKWIS